MDCCCSADVSHSFHGLSLILGVIKSHQTSSTKNVDEKQKKENLTVNSPGVCREAHPWLNSSVAVLHSADDVRVRDVHRATTKVKVAHTPAYAVLHLQIINKHLARL